MSPITANAFLEQAVGVTDEQRAKLRELNFTGLRTFDRWVDVLSDLEGARVTVYRRGNVAPVGAGDGAVNIRRLRAIGERDGTFLSLQGGRVVPATVRQASTTVSASTPLGAPPEGSVHFNIAAQTAHRFTEGSWLDLGRYAPHPPTTTVSSAAPTEHAPAGSLHFNLADNRVWRRAESGWLFVGRTAPVSAARVAWRFDATNFVIIDGHEDTFVTLVPKDLFQSATYSISRIEGLAAALAGKADLVGGRLPLNQLPSGAINRVWHPASESAMLALNAFVGDIAVISGERFLLTGSPQHRPDWFSLDSAGGVNSVNGQTGIVQLTAASVGAIPSGTTAVQLGGAASGHTHGVNQITDLNAWLPGRLVAGTGVTLNTGSDNRVTVNVAASGLGIDWGDIGNKPSAFASTWALVSGKPATFTPSAHTHTRTQITDFAHVHNTADITEFDRHAVNAVSGAIVSDTLEVTRNTTAGQMRLEVKGGGTSGTLRVEEADGSPALDVARLIFPNGALTDLGNGTASVQMLTGGTGESMSYSPTYQRVATATNPLPYRDAVRIAATVRTAYAQASGADFAVYDAAGQRLPAAVVARVPGPSYADYRIVWGDTLNASQSRTYKIAYGDPYSPAPPTRLDAFYDLLNRRERLAHDGQTIVRLDPLAAYRSPDFDEPGSWTLTSNGQIQTLPNGSAVTWGGVEVASVRHRIFGSASSPTFELLDSAGVRVGALVNDWGAWPSLEPWGSVATYGHTQRTFRQLADGCVWDMRLRDGSNGIYEFSVRYQVVGRWSVTHHHRSGGVNVVVALATSTTSVSLMHELGVWGSPSASDPTSWTSLTLLPPNLTAATVGDETVFAL